MINSDMKKWLVSAIMICLVLVLAVISAGCGGEAEVYFDPKEPVVAEVGGEFIIALDFDLIHIWRETHDEGMLSLVEHKFDDSPQGGGMANIAQHFRFRALRKGETEVAFNKMDMDGKTVMEHRVFKVRIE